MLPRPLVFVAVVSWCAGCPASPTHSDPHAAHGASDSSGSTSHPVEDDSESTAPSPEPETSTSDASTEDGPTPDTTTGGDPTGSQCQADVQDCPDGFKCVLRRDERAWEFVCLPVLGDGGAGDACMHDGVVAGTDTCNEDTWCIGSFDTTGAPWDGVCYPLCVGGSCEALDDVCVGIGMLPICATACDPLLAGSCGEAESCILRGYEEGFVCFPSGADPHGQGEPCETGISCIPGLHCSQNVAGCDPDDYCCTALCDVDVPGDACAEAGPMAQCQAIGVTTPGQEHVGACVAP
ncbi:hypothetical protein [Paraliomyxa miuraensis]|uniref:hypothetical protein n=1 Tax=Paraliomyxa miuraensis TaxID=376150 RepID=UPI00224D631C|nr:hypothetical protein [Paraliomyxa miuraensis]MCX4239967.1 hypothetical protein [Paraliomyxa miuraensis]